MDEIVDLIYEGLSNHIESEYLSTLKIRLFLAETIKENSTVFLTTKEADGLVVGVFLGVTHIGLFDNKQYATCLMSYIKPDYRDGVRVSEMAAEFEEWAIAKKVNQINILTFSQLDKPLKARGYNATESLFIKSISDNNL